MNNKQLYYVVEWKQDAEGKTSKRYMHSDHRQKWKPSHKGAMVFQKGNAETIMRDYNTHWRDYIFETDIELVVKQEPAPMLEPKEPSYGMCKVDYDYIASFIVDLRHQPDDEILDRQYVAVNGTFDSSHYYSECVSNTDLEHFIQNRDEIPDGVYQMAFQVTCKGEKYWTDCGYEYDAWEEYEMISCVELTEDEYMFLLKERHDEYVTILADEYDELMDAKSGIHRIGDGM